MPPKRKPEKHGERQYEFGYQTAWKHMLGSEKEAAEAKAAEEEAARLAAEAAAAAEAGAKAERERQAAKAKERADREARQKAEAEERAKAQAEAQARDEAEAKARALAEAEAKAKARTQAALQRTARITLMMMHKRLFLWRTSDFSVLTASSKCGSPRKGNGLCAINVASTCLEVRGRWEDARIDPSSRKRC